MILPLLAEMVAALTVGPVTAPALRPMPIAEVQRVLRTEPGYTATLGGRARAAVVGAYAIDLPAGRRVIGAYSPGYLPLKIRLDDGSCFSLQADYISGEIKNARITPSACGGLPPEDMPQAPPGPNLRLVDTTWRYGVWVDDRLGETVVTSPIGDHPVMLRLAMPVVAVRALTSPDDPSSTMSAVGTLDGRTVVVVFDTTF